MPPCGGVAVSQGGEGTSTTYRHHHYTEIGFVAGVEGLTRSVSSANADIVVTLEEKKSGRPIKLG